MNYFEELKRKGYEQGYKDGMQNSPWQPCYELKPEENRIVNNAYLKGYVEARELYGG